MPELKGFSHVDLTVSNGEQSAAWWKEVLGFDLINRFHGETFEGWTLAHPTGVIVSVMTHQPSQPGVFDVRRVGLDHLSFAVSDRDEIEQWLLHLDEKGVVNSGIIEAEFGPTLVFRDPDNIQLELFVPPSQ